MSKRVLSVDDEHTILVEQRTLEREIDLHTALEGVEGVRVPTIAAMITQRKLGLLSSQTFRPNRLARL